MRRYHLDCDRTVHRAINSLLKLRRAEAAARRTADGDQEEPADEPEAATEMATDPPSSEIAPTCGCAAEPGRDSAVPNEPMPPAVDLRIPRNEATPAAHGEEIAPNEPTPPAVDARVAPNEPNAPRRTAAPAVPARAFALVILLLTGLSSALAGAFGRASGGPGIVAGAPGRYREGAGRIPIPNEPKLESEPAIQGIGPGRRPGEPEPSPNRQVDDRSIAAEPPGPSPICQRPMSGLALTSVRG
jgi:hypothetical protein